MKSTARNLPGVLSLAVAIIIFISGCDPSFSPIEEGYRQYSIFGYLNASADTQFVRIEKLRDSLPAGTSLRLDAEVRLTNLTNGRTEIMQDSVFEYRSGRAHNYYTTMKINPTQKYRMEVKGTEGTSSAVVNIPDSFPEPEVVANGKYRTSLMMRNINRLISVKTIFHTCSAKEGCNCDKPTRYTYSHLNDTLQMEDGRVKAKINLLDEKRTLALNFPPMDTNPDVIRYHIVKYDVTVAGGTSEWPNYFDLDPEAVALPGVATNITNGVGYLGGIVSDTLNMVNSCSDIKISRDELPQNGI